MSRRHPIEDAFKDDPPPWPWYTERAAAKVLGVDREFISGLANNPLPSCKREGKTGASVVLFEKAAVDLLAAKMRAGS